MLSIFVFSLVMILTVCAVYFCSFSLQWQWHFQELNVKLWDICQLVQQLPKVQLKKTHNHIIVQAAVQYLICLPESWQQQQCIRCYILHRHLSFAVHKHEWLTADVTVCLCACRSRGTVDYVSVTVWLCACRSRGTVDYMSVTVWLCACRSRGTVDYVSVTVWLCACRSRGTVDYVSADITWSMCRRHCLHHQVWVVLWNGWRWSQE